MSRRADLKFVEENKLILCVFCLCFCLLCYCIFRSLLKATSGEKKKRKTKKKKNSPAALFVSVFFFVCFAGRNEVTAGETKRGGSRSAPTPLHLHRWRRVEPCAANDGARGQTRHQPPALLPLFQNCPQGLLCIFFVFMCLFEFVLYF